jgi:hypothetical protein
MNQVHKENLTHVENAIPGRQGLDIEIFGMEGVPADILDQHNQQVTQKHFAEEAERARITGNPVRGLFSNGTAPPTKRPKVNESLDEIEERANKYRHDRKNGILPVPPPADAAPTLPVSRTAAAHVHVDIPLTCTPQTPPTAAPYGAPPFSPATASGFPPPNAPFAPGASIPGRPGSTPGQAGALPPRPGFANGGAAPADAQAISASLDDLIGQARKDAGPEERKEEKKKKAANIKLVFFDESVSPEEKMALLPRFAEFARA